jgi:hypothetical protein
MESSISSTKLTHHIIGEDRCRRMAWNYDCKGETTEMTAGATATCRLVREQAEEEEREKGAKESKRTRQECRHVYVCMIKFN